MNPLAKVFGANWQPKVFGGIFILSLFVVSNHDLVAAVIPPNVSNVVFGWAALISGFIAFWKIKASGVTGGDVQQTVSGKVVQPGKANLVDATLVGTVQSGEAVSPKQAAVARELGQTPIVK